MEPVPLPNDILCSGFTDISSVILNQNMEEFAIMSFSSAKKNSSHFLIFICQICAKNFSKNFILEDPFANLKGPEFLEMGKTYFFK